MRMNVCTLIGLIINNVLIEFNGDYNKWLTKMVTIYFPSSSHSAITAFNTLRLEVLVDHLMRFIKFDDPIITNNMCKRSALRF